MTATPLYACFTVACPSCEVILTLQRIPKAACNEVRTPARQDAKAEIGVDGSGRYWCGSCWHGSVGHLERRMDKLRSLAGVRGPEGEVAALRLREAIFRQAGMALALRHARVRADVREFRLTLLFSAVLGVFGPILLIAAPHLVASGTAWLMLGLAMGAIGNWHIWCRTKTRSDVFRSLGFGTYLAVISWVSELFLIVALRSFGLGEA